MSTSIISTEAILESDVLFGEFNIIEPGAIIKSGARIGNFCRIQSGVVIGENTIIHDYVELREGTIIGDRCVIDSRVSSSGDCVIGDEVVVRYDSIIARGVRIGKGSYICPRVMTNNLDTEHKSIGGAHIGKNAFIGTNAVLHHGISLGDRVIIGSLSFVNTDCDADSVYVGSPAKLIRKN